MRTLAFILLAALTAFAVGCKKKTDPTTGGGNIVPGSDQDRLQGVWAIESVEEAKKKGQRPDDLTGVRFQFKGDRLTIFEGSRVDVVFAFTLDTAQDPKVMTLVELGHDGQPLRRGATRVGTAPRVDAGEVQKEEWLYKFEGDTLVLAVTKDPGPRPTEFKPRAGQPQVPAVFIAKLKKTDETPASDTQPPRRASPTTRLAPRPGTRP
jgi:uncharacterized protein (TIGR03067 family)